MVYYDTESLSLAFAALADPTRRAIIDRLASERELAVLEIAAPFAVSLPAVIKHLDVRAPTRSSAPRPGARSIAGCGRKRWRPPSNG